MNGQFSGDALKTATDGLVSDAKYLIDVDSTNRVALDWAAEGALDMSIVVTDYQGAGRGRLDRQWICPPGVGLLFSLVLRPGLPKSEWPLIGLLGGASLSECLRAEGFPSEVKWPNDVLVDGAKVAGVLSESRGDVVALGIGVNVNLDRDDFPPEIRSSATSLLLSDGKLVDRAALLSSFLLTFRTRYFDNVPDLWVEFYSEHCATLGREVKVETAGIIYQGLAKRIDEAGSLVLDDGTSVSTGDVIHLNY